MSIGAVADLLEDQPAVRVDPAVQRQRDDGRLKILRDELGRESDPKMRSAIQLEIDNTGGGKVYGAPRAASPLSGIAEALDDGGKVAPPPVAGATAPEPESLPWKAARFVADNVSGRTALEVGLNAATGVGSTIMGGWRGLAALVSGAGLDEAARQVHAPDLPGGTTARPYEPSESSAFAADMANAPGAAIGWAGKQAGEAVMEAGGLPRVVDPLRLVPPAEGATIAETGANAVPLALIRRGAVARAEPRLVGSGSIADIAKPAIEAQPNYDIPTVMRRREPVPVERQPLTLAPNEPRAARGPSVFDQPEVQPAQAAAAAVEEAPKFADEAPSAQGGVPKAAQSERENVLRSVGITDVRKSAIAGDPAEMRTDLDLSKRTGSEGERVRGVLEAERGALTRYGEQIVSDTGGSSGIDGTALYNRGNAIVSPLQGLKTWFDKNTRSLYAEADQAAGGTPKPLERTAAVLVDESEFLGTQEGEALLKGVRARAKALEIADKDGNIVGATAKQAERLRQYLGDQWTPRTSRLIGRLKDTLDEDVTAGAGSDIYQKARAMRAMRSAVFENDIVDAQGRMIPNGVGKLVDASGKNIELLKSTEKIPDAIAGLPVDELAQVVKTLRSMPAELQPQAQAAMAEIKSQFANRILEAGSRYESQWGAPQVTKYLQANAAKLRLLFDDAELAKIKSLNDAGHILRTGPYPGAAVQTGNLMRSGVEHGLSSLGSGTGAVVGGLLAGPPGAAAGAAVGGAAGKALSGKVQQGMSMRAVEKRLTTLKDIAESGK